MRSMKTLLRLMGAVALSTVAASSVVACGNAKAPQLNGKYAMLLGWYNDETTSNIKQKLSKDESVPGKEKEEITIDNKQIIISTDFQAMLLEVDKSYSTKFKAKSDDAAKFLADLGFKSGSKSQVYSDPDTKAITALKVKIASIEAGKIEANSKKDDFNVGVGTCQVDIMDKSGDDAKVVKSYTINTNKKDEIGVPTEVGLLVTKVNLVLTKEKGYVQDGKVLPSLLWADSKDKEKRLYDSLVKLFGKESLSWTSDPAGQTPITKYPTTNGSHAYLTVKFGNIKVLVNLDCGEIPAAY